MCKSGSQSISFTAEVLSRKSTSVPVSGDSEPAAKQNSAIIGFIIHTCASPTVTGQRVLSERGLSHLRVFHLIPPAHLQEVKKTVKSSRISALWVRLVCWCALPSQCCLIYLRHFMAYSLIHLVLSFGSVFPLYLKKITFCIEPVRLCWQKKAKGRLTLCPGTTVSRTANNAVEWCSTPHTHTHRVKKKHLASAFKAVENLGTFGRHCVRAQWEGQGHPVDRSWTFQLGTSALCGAYVQPGECR